MEEDPAQAADQASSTVCRACGVEPFEPGHVAELCAGCRSKLANRPIPVGIRIAGYAVGAAALMAAALSPTSLTAGVAFERGRRAEEANDYAAAVKEYERVVARFPRSTLALGRMGISCFRDGQLQRAAAAFEKLGGRQADQKLVGEINQAIQEMEQLVDRLDQEGGP